MRECYHDIVMLDTQFSWTQFSQCNIDGTNIHERFENLCRQIFVNTYLKGESRTKYLRTNPNNPGIEVEPIYCEKENKRIGFQAKYFENGRDYKAISDSFKKTVRYYSNKIDLLILYCNMDLSLTSKSVIDAEKLLSDNNISLEIVTNKAIIDLVKKYPYLGEYYFSAHTISNKKLNENNSHRINELRERFNQDFSIDTASSNKLSLFTLDHKAIELINKKKSDLINEIESLQREYDSRFHNYTTLLKQTVTELPDIEFSTIEDSFSWYNQIHEKINQEYSILESQLIDIEDDLLKEGKEYNDTRKKFHLKKMLSKLLGIPDLIKIEKEYENLIKNKVLAIKGTFGVGKSHLLAKETRLLTEEMRSCLLLVGGSYLSDEEITVQIMNKLRLQFTFDQLIDVLEAKGEKDGKPFIILIDAINETWNHTLWKNSLIDIISLIQKCNFVKLVFSYRSDYEQLLLNSEIEELIKQNEICCYEHKGFVENSVQAARMFFNSYRIPFTLYEYFSFEMTKPLFLQLYCKTYQEGDEFDLGYLYEKLIEKANKKIFHNFSKQLSALGYTEINNILISLIEELAKYFSYNRIYIISRNDILNLRFWHDCLGDTGIKNAYITKVVQEGILNEYHRCNEVIYTFAYDHMNDYFCAKAIFKGNPPKEELRNKIKTQFLCLDKNSFPRLGAFSICCALYAEQFGEECIDLVDDINTEWVKEQSIADYFNSYKWRSSKSISKERFLAEINKYDLSRSEFDSILISNSLKPNHPLNADFLHSLLLKQTIADRDYMWTCIINSPDTDEISRAFELVEEYSKGNNLIQADKEQLSLLLTLLGWLLSSSNRTLRDKTTKAMIEILKMNFDLCPALLKEFEVVNDPYVYQRIYAAVFGACCKRNETQLGLYQKIAEYVYSTIFDKDEVYPDILLRDYARLIIERFLWEEKNYTGIIQKSKIIPPYKSKLLPTIKSSPYYPYPENNKMTDKNWGTRKIINSMKLEEFRHYGDFGRYVFESKLKNFDVDVIQMFNLALSIIFDELGYKDTLFSQNDKKTIDGYCSRRQSQIERIGKKYEWIAYFNIIARVSDQCKMQNRFNSEKILKTYQGPWDPFIRDFDPTLNLYSILPHSSAPVLQTQEKIIKEEIQYEVNIKPEDYSSWLKNKCLLIEKLSEILLQCDNNGIEWLYLDASFETSHDEFEECRLSMWSMVKAYLVSEKQQEELKTLASKHICLWDYYINERENTFYHSYNREYPWAPCFNDISQHIISERDFILDEHEPQDTVIVPNNLEKTFLDLHEEALNTDGKKIEINQNKEDEDICSNDHNDDENQEYELTENSFEKKIMQNIKYLAKPQNYRCSQPITKSIGRIMHACVKFINEDMDSRPEWHAPCPDIIETLELKQTKHDFTYYDKNDDIAAYDTSFINKTCPGLIIRKDLIDSYLQKKNLKLIWIMLSEQQLHNSDGIGLEDLKQWTGLCTYDGLKVLSSSYELEKIAAKDISN